jgi:hypothetical protein
MDETTLVAISACMGGPTTFVITSQNSNGRQRVVSSSLIIHNTLLPALFTGAKPVELEFYPATRVIKRVKFFSLGPLPSGPFFGDYRVSRIATQRAPNGTREWLEVFLKKLTEDEELKPAYNVFDPFLQLNLIAAFRREQVGQGILPVDIRFENDEKREGEILAVTLGEKVRMS